MASETAVTDRHRDTRRKLEELEREMRAEVMRFAQEFKEEAKRLKTRYAANPEKLISALDELMRRHHDVMRDKWELIRAIAPMDMKQLPLRTVRGGADYDRMPHRRGPPGPRRKPRRRPDAGGVLVEPNRPKDLSGGAAAPLSFDD